VTIVCDGLSFSAGYCPAKSAPVRSQCQCSGGHSRFSVDFLYFYSSRVCLIGEF
jgi:hypothetical protein